MEGAITDKNADIVALDDAKRKRRAAKAASQVRGRDVDQALRDLPGFNPVLFDIEAGSWPPDADTSLPPHCPVVALGYDEESVYFLAARGTIAKLPANASKGHIDLLFTPYKNYPVWAWPQRAKKKQGQSKGDVMGNFAAEEAKRDLFAAAERAGPWDPVEQVRGRGAWLLDPDPETDTPARLLLHLGDRLEVGGGSFRTGLYDGLIYPGAKPIPAPVPAGTPGIEGGTDGPGDRLMQFLSTWDWMRGSTDAQLLLGWMACAFVGGALRWRPYVFLTGDQGAGKSFAIEFVEAVLGEGGLIKSEDATEAGVAQTLRHDSLPVLLDELENEGDSRRASNIIQMARRAASGTQKIRGGQDHTASSFTIRSCFLFAAINAPTLGPQDMARMALLRLRPFDDRKTRVKPDVREAAALGRALHRRILEWFRPGEDGLTPRIDGVLDLIRAALMRPEDKGGAGHNDRGADTFGFLLAGYWCAVEDELPDEETVLELVRPLAKSSLAEYEAITPEWLACWRHMLNEPHKQLERDAYKSIGAVLDAWRVGGDGGLDATAVRKKMEHCGMSIKWLAGTPRTYDEALLFVPLANSKVASIFQGTRWGAESREAAGAWTNALRGGPAEFIFSDQGRMGRTKMRGTSIRIADLVGFRKGHKQFREGVDSDDEEEVDHG